MENRKLGFRQIACVTIISAVVGGAAGFAGGILGKNSGIKWFSKRCQPLAEIQSRCPKSVTDRFSLDELRTFARRAVEQHADRIRQDLDLDGNGDVKIRFSIDIGKTGDVRLRSVSARSGSDEKELQSGWGLMIAAEILHGEQVEPPPLACTHSFEVDVPPTNSCH
jgi:hypothetical protein